MIACSSNFRLKQSRKDPHVATSTSKFTAVMLGVHPKANVRIYDVQTGQGVCKFGVSMSELLTAGSGTLLCPPKSFRPVGILASSLETMECSAQEKIWFLLVVGLSRGMLGKRVVLKERSQQ